MLSAQRRRIIWSLPLQVLYSLRVTTYCVLWWSPSTLRIHTSWKILRNIPSEMNLLSQHIVCFLCCSSFVITKDIPKNTNLFFFPKQSYSSTLMCSQLPSCCLVTSRWVSGVFFSEAIMMYRESYVANQLNYKQKGWPQYDFKIPRTLIFYH